MTKLELEFRSRLHFSSLSTIILNCIMFLFFFQILSFYLFKFKCHMIRAYLVPVPVRITYIRASGKVIIWFEETQLAVRNMEMFSLSCLTFSNLLRFVILCLKQANSTYCSTLSFFTPFKIYSLPLWNLINSYCWNYHFSANDIWFHSVSSLSGLEHIFETLIDFLSWNLLMLWH